MDYFFAMLFLGMYYIRPQDWVPGLVGANVIRPVMLGWFGSVAGYGSSSKIPGWFSTPHDWVIAIYYAYVVWTAPPGIGAGMGMFSLVVFYFLTVHALGDWQRLLGYLKLWNVLLLCIAGFGVLQVLGMDITGGRQTTEFFLGRLSLGTWLADNPNALGHTVVLAIPLSYVLFFWRGSGAGRLFIFPACFALAGWCAWQTQSKGSFLVGAGLTVLIFVVGRPKWVQIMVVSLALVTGVGALSFLPRMEEMGNLRADEGVLGRLMAWEMAKTSMDSNTFGVGWKQFIALLDWQDGRRFYHDIPKATHCSYVQVGADLGRYGLYLYLMGIWVALRTLLSGKGLTDDQERCRRAVLLLLLGYLASGWMINRQYHTEYFLMIAAAAAIHRLKLAREEGLDSTAEATLDDGGADGAVGAASWGGGARAIPGQEHIRNDLDESGLPQTKPRKMWNRLGWLDLAMTGAMTWGVLWTWDYILKNL